METATNNNTPDVTPTETPTIRAENLTRVVDGARLVDDVSFTVTNGRTLVIVGPSGAGKSSLLRLINRLDEPTSGTVYVDGIDYRDIAPQALRRRMGMVMQEHNLFPGTVADNVRYGPALLGKTLSVEQVEALLKRVDLSGYANRDAEKLSGGESQRVSVARTLADQPEVLLLDEPTAALDESTKHEVETVVFDLIRDKSMTCIMVTHDLGQARRVADTVLALEQGRMVRSGTPEEVLDAA